MELKSFDGHKLQRDSPKGLFRRHLYIYDVSFIFFFLYGGLHWFLVIR